MSPQMMNMMGNNNNNNSINKYVGSNSNSNGNSNSMGMGFMGNIVNGSKNVVAANGSYGAGGNSSSRPLSNGSQNSKNIKN